MRSQIFVILGCAMWVMGCAEKAPETPAQMEGTEAPDSAVEKVATEAEIPGDADFLRHMHWHAEKLDELNFALADGDLEGAGTPAYWLSRHDQVEGISAELQPYLANMRAAALAVEEASDLDTARAAAERINEQCQGCHEKAGVTTE